MSPRFWVTCDGSYTCYKRLALASQPDVTRSPQHPQDDDCCAPKAPDRSGRNEKLDRFGATASTLCAIHCALTALLPAALSVIGAGFLLAEQAEWIFTGIAVAFAAGALAVGWKRHRSSRVALVLALGIFGLLASRGVEMMGGHHDHGSGHDAHHEAEHGDAHGDGHEAGTHDGDGIEWAHFVGTAIGVAAGMLLLAGHILNIRATRSCCDDDA